LEIQISLNTDNNFIYLANVHEFSPSLRGDDSKRDKIHRKFFKILFRTSRPKSIKLGTNYPLMKRIQVCSNKGPGPLRRGIIIEM
jgi:hypothetical protein